MIEIGNEPIIIRLEEDKQRFTRELALRIYSSPHLFSVVFHPLSQLGQQRD